MSVNAWQGVNSWAGAADSVPPVITLLGLPDMFAVLDAPWLDPGATALDDVDGNITDSIVVSGLVDTSTPGSYTLRYNVSDSSGNAAAEVERTVQVVADLPNGFESAAAIGVYQALTNAAGVMAIATGVYDDVPKDVVFPYITIGDAKFTALDTDTRAGVELDIIVNIWSTHKGRKEVQKLQGAIYTTLNRAALSFPGYHFVTCDFVSSDTMVEPGGKIRHGVQVFRIFLTEV